MWRDKYFSALDNLESEQKDAEVTIDVLRRGLLSVSLAGDGLDADLDSKLGKLRAQLKTARDYPTISELLQAIEADLIRLDTAKAESSKNQKQHTSDALSLLLKSSIDSEIKKELKEFQKKIKASDQQNDSARKFESDLINLLLPLLTELSSDYLDKNPADGLWDRFKKSVATTSKEDSEKPQSPLLTQSTAKQSNTTPTPDSSQQLATADLTDSQLLDKTKLFVVKLIKQLYGNIALAEVAKLLSQEISDSDTEALLSRYPKVLNLIELARTQDKKEFLNYLGEINYSLSKINQSIANSSVVARKLKSAKNQQQKRLRGGVDKIRKILDTATDLESAKSKTQETLDALVSSIESSAKTDQESLDKFEELQASQKTELKRIEEQTQKTNDCFDLAADKPLLTETDSLTKLKSAAALREKLAQQLEVHQAQHKILCLCVGDVKGLALLNEKYGKNAGDKALELLARQLESKMPVGDFLNYGGNGQYMFTKEHCVREDALAEIESLNAELANLPFRFKGDEVKIQLCFAIEESVASDTPDSLLERLNRSLLEAKQVEIH